MATVTYDELIDTLAPRKPEKLSLTKIDLELLAGALMLNEHGDYNLAGIILGDGAVFSLHEPGGDDDFAHHLTFEGFQNYVRLEDVVR